MKWYRRWKSRRADAKAWAESQRTQREKECVHDETVRVVLARVEQLVEEARHRNPTFMVRWYPEIHPKDRGKYVG